jgi:hypothetical protein
MPVPFQRVYLESAGYFMPGEPVSNEGMDAYIAPLNRMSERIKRRILAENGIRERYYAIDAEGRTVHSNAQLAAGAVRHCLAQGAAELSRVSLLASGSSGGDTLMPGFANMIQGELAAPPMETLSVHGICAAGVSRRRPRAWRWGHTVRRWRWRARCPRASSSARASRPGATTAISMRTSCAGCCPMAPALCCCRTVRQRWPEPLAQPAFACA